MLRRNARTHADVGVLSRCERTILNGEWQRPPTGTLQVLHIRVRKQNRPPLLSGQSLRVHRAQMNKRSRRRHPRRLRLHGRRRRSRSSCRGRRPRRAPPPYGCGALLRRRRLSPPSVALVPAAAPPALAPRQGRRARAAQRHNVARLRHRRRLRSLLRRHNARRRRHAGADQRRRRRRRRRRLRRRRGRAVGAEHASLRGPRRRRRRRGEYRERPGRQEVVLVGVGVAPPVPRVQPRPRNARTRAVDEPRRRRRRHRRRLRLRVAADLLGAACRGRVAVRGRNRRRVRAPVRDAGASAAAALAGEALLNDAAGPRLRVRRLVAAPREGVVPGVAEHRAAPLAPPLRKGLQERLRLQVVFRHPQRCAVRVGPHRREADAGDLAGVGEVVRQDCEAEVQPHLEAHVRRAAGKLEAPTPPVRRVLPRGTDATDEEVQRAAGVHARARQEAVEVAPELLRARHGAHLLEAVHDTTHRRLARRPHVDPEAPLRVKRGRAAAGHRAGDAPVARVVLLRGRRDPCRHGCCTGNGRRGGESKGTAGVEGAEGCLHGIGRRGAERHLAARGKGFFPFVSPSRGSSLVEQG
eukprot:Rhum_TRINITY_DN12847_c0_g1::Rhum_TRINITY_DN12847_c0_g1_i1::g.54903::m.54903